jgi:hypothetical protein
MSPLPNSIELPDFSRYTPCYGMLKEAEKTWQHFVSDKLVYLLQSDKIALDSLMGIAKDYIEGNAWIEAHVTFEVNGRTNHACVIVVSAKGDEFLRKVGKPKAGDVLIDRNPSVFINVAERVEPPQEIVFDGEFGIRSDVWLKRLNDFDCFCGYSPREVFDLGIIGGVENRELRTPGVVLGDVCKTPDKLIQRRPDAIQEIANDEGKLLGDVLNFDTNNVPLSFKIILTGKTYRIGFHKSSDAFPQVLKVFFRPSGFQIGIG